MTLLLNDSNKKLGKVLLAIKCSTESVCETGKEARLSLQPVLPANMCTELIETAFINDTAFFDELELI